MRILYIHQYFATPKGSTGTRSYEFARRWVKEGHEVTLITCNCDISGLDAGSGVIQKQAIDGIDIIIAGIRCSNKHSFMHRIISFLCFIFFCIYAGLKIKNVNVIYATSTPLTIGVPASLGIVHLNCNRGVASENIHNFYASCVFPFFRIFVERKIRNSG